MKQNLKINLGCGNVRMKGYVGMDVVKLPAVDVVHDLNKFPYPFKDNSVQEVFADNVLEHVENLVRVMEELHRICVPGAIIKIYVPYAKSDGAFKDPTHKNFFMERTFQYFSPAHVYNFYSKARFEVMTLKHISNSNDFRQKVRNIIPFRKFLKFFLLNMYDTLYFELKVLKQSTRVNRKSER